MDLSKFDFTLGSVQTKAAASETIEVILEELDTENSGYIDKREFSKALIGRYKRSHIAVDEKFVEESLLSDDEDDSGLISKEELKSILNKILSRYPGL